MKKAISICILIVCMAVGLGACAQSNPIGSEKGNSNGNVNNYGIYAEKDGWVFYADIMNHYTLTKMKVDGTEKMAYDQHTLKDINIVGDFVYYVSMLDSSQAFLFKMKTDGSQTEQVSQIPIDYYANCIVSGGMVYFSNADDKSSIYSMKTDGSEAKKLNDLASFKQNLDGEWIFYIQVSTDEDTGNSINQLRKVNINGTDDQVLAEAVGTNCLAHDGWVYYDAAEEDNALYRIKYDGAEKTKLSETGVSSINILGDSLLYISTERGTLMRCGLDGSDAAEVAQNGSGILVAGDWIYFANRNEAGRMYRVHLDGTGLEKAYTVALVEPAADSVERDKGLGSINVNLNGDSKFVSKGDWIYFNTDPFDGPIKKMKSDGTGVEEVADFAATRLNIVGDWIYFINADSFSMLARVKTDGSEYGVILDTSCAELIVRDDWMYFTDSNQKNKLYKIKTDGTQLTKLSDAAVVNLNLEGDWLYYAAIDIGTSDHSGIYKIKTDGTNKTVLSGVPNNDISVSGQWIYYTSTDAFGMETQLRKMKVDGSADTLINNDNTVTLSGVYQDWLYYFSGDNEEGLVRTHLDGTGRQVLVGPGNYVWIHFIGDKIIYYDNGQEKFRIMDLDGSNQTDFQ